jgi:hypothetical protein
MRVAPASETEVDGNDTETLSSRKGNTHHARSTRMPSNLTLETQESELVLRCECGMTVLAESEKRLVELTRLHFGEFHPDLGANVPADLILAMAEQKGERQQ